MENQALLLRAEEVAKLLSLGRSKVFEMIAADELPCVRIGRSVRVSRAALEQWVRERSGEPAPVPHGTEGRQGAA